MSAAISVVFVSCELGGPPRATRFLYTTLFRSHSASLHSCPRAVSTWWQQTRSAGSSSTIKMRWLREVDRSEEHTSELQSQFHLVCRLLLEKKNDSGSYGRRVAP